MRGKTDFYGIVAQAQDMVPGFKEGTVIYIRPDFKAKCCPCCSKGEMHVIMSLMTVRLPNLQFNKGLNRSSAITT